MNPPRSSCFIRPDASAAADWVMAEASEYGDEESRELFIKILIEELNELTKENTPKSR